MANTNLKQNINEFKIHNNAWTFNYEGTEVLVMKIPECDYWAGVDGNIYSLKLKKIKRLSPCNSGDGYLKVRLSIGPKMQAEYVHRLVARAWLEDGGVDHMGNSRIEINHINGDKSNNKLCNLEWCSKSENSQHFRRVLKAKDFLISKNHK
jgi:HNH endonuclease